MEEVYLFVLMFFKEVVEGKMGIWFLILCLNVIMRWLRDMFCNGFLVFVLCIDIMGLLYVKFLFGNIVYFL